MVRRSLLLTVASLLSVDANLVVGYVPTYRADCMSTLDYSALTHLTAAFLGPGSDGSFSAPGDLKGIVSQAKSHGVTTFVAIGGGGADVSTWLSYMTADKAEETAAKIVQSALDMGADGVDVDLEGDLVLADSYNNFVAKLSAATKAHGLGLSAALAKWTASQAITDDTLRLFDFVGLMAYDYKGPWDTTPPLEHSPYSAAEDELNYYVNTRGLPANKVALGVPFYGYDFSDTSHVTDFTWSEIVNNYPEHMDDDAFDGKDYNGKVTIREKAQLAKNMGAGIMVWELGQDVPPGENSLLRQIKTVMAGGVLV